MFEPQREVGYRKDFWGAAVDGLCFCFNVSQAICEYTYVLLSAKLYVYTFSLAMRSGERGAEVNFILFTASIPVLMSC